MRQIFGGLAIALMLAAPAAAQSLEQGLSGGAIGEKADGYVAACPGAPGWAASVVNQVNAERRARYQQLASEHNVPVQVVEQKAGEKRAQSIPSGWMLYRNGQCQAK